MGTGAPETAVSITAALKGNAGIAVAKTTVRYEIPIMLACYGAYFAYLLVK